MSKRDLEYMILAIIFSLSVLFAGFVAGRQTVPTYTEEATHRVDIYTKTLWCSPGGELEFDSAYEGSPTRRW